jgi:ferredoxin-thioredoxin reductase catalytic subunit
MSQFPGWWKWLFEISPHAYRRMPERQFTETDLRGMLVAPERIESDICPGRFLIHCRWYGRNWHVIVEPDPDTKTVIIVTAFSPEPPP